VEGLAVLTGILVAFGIDAVWETRQEDLRTEAYLSSLDAELAQNADSIRAHLSEIDSTRAVTAGYIVRLTDGPEGLSGDSVNAMVWAMAIADRAPLSRSALDDLVAGGLQSIKDAELRRTLLSYGQALEFNDRRVRATEVWWDARFAPYDEMHADLVGVGSEYAGGWLDRSDLSLGVDPVSFYGSRQYTNLLAARSLRLRMIGLARADLLETIEELRAVIAR